MSVSGLDSGDSARIECAPFLHVPIYPSGALFLFLFLSPFCPTYPSSFSSNVHTSKPGLTTSRRMRGCISRRRRGVFLFVASIGTIELPVTWSFELPRGPSKVPKNPAREGRKNSVCCIVINTLLSLSMRGLTTMTRTSVVYSNAYGIIYMSVDVHNFQAILSSGISLKGPSFFISDRVEHPPLRSARFSLVIILIIIRMNF